MQKFEKKGEFFRGIFPVFDFALLERPGYFFERLQLFGPVNIAIKLRKEAREGWVLPAVADPGGIREDAQSSEGGDQVQFAFFKMAKFCVAGKEEIQFFGGIFNGAW